MKDCIIGFLEICTIGLIAELFGNYDLMILVIVSSILIVQLRGEK